MLSVGFDAERTPYDALGGEEALRALVETFYDRMNEAAPHIRSMHPADDSTSREKLFEFLSGWLGGAALYEEKYGHPRLRGRHAPFAVDQRAVEDWLGCMAYALDERGVEGELRAFLDGRFAHVANFMRNC